jgi:transposase
MSTDVPSSLDPQQLPDDPALLKQIIAEHRAQLARLQTEQQTIIDHAVAAQIDSAVESAVAVAVKSAVKAAVEATTAALLKRFYGPKNETFDPRQLLLFGERIDQLPLDETKLTEETGEEVVSRRVQKKHKHGRNPLPDHLPRIEIEHDLSETEKLCPCCGEVRCRIGQEISEQLEYLPASFKVLRHIRPKYACRACDAAGNSPNIQSQPKPPQPIDKGLAGPGLLAYVAVSKFGDHLPLYRLENIFARQQVHVARSTMCAWLAAGAKLLEPLVELMIARVKQSRVSTPTTRACRFNRRVRRSAAAADCGLTSAMAIIHTSCSTTRPIAAARDRRPGSAIIAVTCKPMRMALTTASMRPVMFTKWPAGRMRGESSSTR